MRTLHYYDDIGLLKPAFVDETTGYRYYDENSLLRMQAILFYRELDFSLKNIRKILSSTDFDRRATLEEQKKLLILKKERLERLISSIDEAMKGANVMSAFDNSEFEKYKSEVQKRWGSTEAYKEYSEKAEDYTVVSGNKHYYQQGEKTAVQMPQSLPLMSGQFYCVYKSSGFFIVLFAFFCYNKKVLKYFN